MNRPAPVGALQAPRDVLIIIPPALREDGKPTIQAWKRAGRTKAGRSFDPPQQVKWKAEINAAIWDALPPGLRAPAWPVEALRIDVVAVLPRPQKHKGPERLDWKTTRPDVDNHGKVVLDSLECPARVDAEMRRLGQTISGAVTFREAGQGGKGARRALVADDAQIAMMCTAKVYAEVYGEARLYVRFRVLDESPELLLTELDVLTPHALSQWKA
ncbi:MAG: RusA family crossover junction endodeoxyribonuclease [Myxococcales bacterium]|nr:RusA family crossover junction endodeoxyribonuclease [Myxococcales bacterium]